MRVTSAVARANKRKALLRQMSGIRGKKARCYVFARTLQVKRSRYQFISRKLLKRDSRSLWIQRISAASQAAFGISYSVFMHKVKSLNMNRKVISEIAFHSMESFEKIFSSAIKQG